MADIQIGPQVVPLARRGPSYPTEAPALRATSESMGHLHEMALHLLNATERQEEATQAANAVVYYKEGLVGLEQSLQGVQDFDEKYNLFKAGQGNIRDNLLKEYPNLHPRVLDHIDTVMAHDEGEQFLKLAAEKVHRGHSEFRASLDNLARIGAEATSDHDRQLAEAHGISLIDSAMANGTIHPEEAADDRTIFLHKIHVAKMNNLVATDPNAALNITYADSHMGPTDYIAFHSKALHAVTGIKDKAAEEFKATRNYWHDEWIKHPEIINNPEVAKFFTAYERSIMRPFMDKGELDHYAHVIRSFSGTPEELRTMFNDKILPLHTDGRGASYLRQIYDEEESKRKTTFGNYIKDSENNLHNYLNSVDPWIPSIGMPDFHSKFKKIFDSNIKTAFRDAKNYDEATKAYNNIIEEINKEFGVKPPAAKPSAAAPSPTGTPSPAATPTPKGKPPISTVGATPTATPTATTTPSPTATPTPDFSKPPPLPPSPSPLPTPSVPSEPATESVSEHYSPIPEGASTITPGGHTFRSELADAQIQAESSGDPTRVSPKGAIGLAQFLPSTAAKFWPGITKEQLHDPEISRWLQHRYMGELLDKYNGNEFKALVAYNEGETLVDKNVFLPESVAYANDVIARANAMVVRSASASDYIPEGGPTEPESAPAAPETPAPEESPGMEFAPEEPEEKPMPEAEPTPATPEEEEPGP